MTTKKKISAAEIRINKDLEALEFFDNIKIKFPDPNDVKTFIIRLHLKDGIWENGNFDFEFKMTDEYPFEAPKVKCLTKVWHPNIDSNGNVCVNVLRENYSSALSLTSIFAGIIFIFTEPNVSDPLNKEAAEEYKKDVIKFRVHAKKVMQSSCPVKSTFD